MLISIPKITPWIVKRKISIILNMTCKCLLLYKKIVTKVKIGKIKNPKFD
tara:strand:+ start:1072 stop:1221 length:150 start_codon:yes stop_codon:yes gene_type:complete